MPLIMRPMTLLTRISLNRAPPPDPAEWAGILTSDVLALTDEFLTVQDDTADMVVEIGPGYQAHIQLVYNPRSSPTELLEWHVHSSVDGSTWDTLNFEGGVLSYTPDPSVISAIIAGVRYFRIEAAKVDLDGTAGDTDVGSTLTVIVAFEQEAP